MDLLIRLAADGTLILLILIASPIVLVRLRERFWQNAPILIMAALTSLFVGKMMSLIYQPAVARPFIEFGRTPGAAYIDNPGFPSDHALLAVVIVIAVHMLTRNWRLTIALSALVLIMCIGRVVALVHTPFDVLGGVLSGFAGVYWYHKLTK